MRVWFPTFKFFSRERQEQVIQPPVKKQEKQKPNVKVINVGSYELYKGTGNFNQKFNLLSSDYAEEGERDMVLASSGMGKSYLMGVMVEETLDNDGVVCIIDPMNETFTLSWEYPFIVVGGDKKLAEEMAAANKELKMTERKHAMEKARERVPFKLKLADYAPEPGDTKEDIAGKQQAMKKAVEDAKEFIDRVIYTMLNSGVSVIWDLSEHGREDQQNIFCLIAESLYNQQQIKKRPMRFVVEEAQRFGPQQSKGKSNQWCEDIAKLGRKNGINSLWGTQRPASLDKDIVSQGGRFWFGGIKSAQDFKAVKSYLEDAGIKQKDVQDLRPGHFYFFNGKETKLIKVKKRKAKHGGKTPEVNENLPVATSGDLETILQSLKAV